MNTRIDAHDLTGLGLTDQEIQAVVSSVSRGEQVRLLRQSRFRLLEDLHNKQQTLDRLDYFIYQIRK